MKFIEAILAAACLSATCLAMPSRAAEPEAGPRVTEAGTFPIIHDTEAPRPDPLVINGCTLKPKADCPGVDLSQADLRGIVLSGANLRGAKLTRANLYNATLKGADLSGADLRGATLTLSLIHI